MTGAAHVECFNHIVRKSNSKGAFGVAKIPGPAMTPHNDFTQTKAEEFF